MVQLRTTLARVREGLTASGQGVCGRRSEGWEKERERARERERERQRERQREGEE